MRSNYREYYNSIEEELHTKVLNMAKLIINEAEFAINVKEGKYSEIFTEPFLNKEYTWLIKDYKSKLLTSGELRAKLFALLSRAAVSHSVGCAFTIADVYIEPRDIISLEYSKEAESLLQAFKIPYKVNAMCLDHFYLNVSEEYAPQLLSIVWDKVKFHSVDHYKNIENMPF